MSVSKIQLNTFPLSGYASHIIPCSCGQTHKISTESILFGASSSSSIRFAVEKFVPLGSAVFLLADHCGASFLPSVKRILARSGYRIGDHIIEDDEQTFYKILSSELQKQAENQTKPQPKNQNLHKIFAEFQTENNAFDHISAKLKTENNALDQIFAKLKTENPSAFEQIAAENMPENHSTLNQISDKLQTENHRSFDQIAAENIAEDLDDSSVYSTKILANFVGLTEDVRVIIAAGGAKATEFAKILATALHLPLIVLAACPDYLMYLAPFVLADDGLSKIIPTDPPAALIADTDWLIAAGMTSDEILASAFGALTSKLIALFDREVAALIEGENHCPYIIEQALALIDSTIERLESTYYPILERSALILEQNIRFSALLQLSNDYALMGGGESQAANCLELLLDAEQRDKRLSGENQLIIASMLSKIYILALSRLTEIGFVPPPDNNLRIETAAHFLGVDQSEILRRLKKTSIESLKIGDYKLREFSSELLALIQNYDRKLKRASKIFKRLYQDCGYSLIGYLDKSDISLSISLAPDLRESFTFLTQLKNMGLLDRYI